ncbi:uncharacterized protein LOC135397114 isoform X2 [Ornithodoros turicata]|uniref:uncharacterized protein LOC135397114 isoform X2 n=1 Tax=Ornithodoros turicata TaxID=34597 RepID=UPI003139987E
MCAATSDGTSQLWWEGLGGHRRRGSTPLYRVVTVAVSEAALCVLLWPWLRDVPQIGVPLFVVLSLAIQLAAAVIWLYPPATSLLRLRRHPEQKPLKAALGIVLVFALAVAVFYVLAVLFGAPLTEQMSETLLFSIHLAALTTLPLVVTRDTTPKALHNLFFGDGSIRCALPGGPNADHRTRVLTRAAMFAVAGAWAGAAALPLDWDRPWQQWPTPCVLGASVGHLLAFLLPVQATGPYL